MVLILVSRLATFSLADTHFDRRSTIRLSGICSCSSSKAPVDECRLPAALVVPTCEIAWRKWEQRVCVWSPNYVHLHVVQVLLCGMRRHVSYRDHHVVSPHDLPHREHLRAAYNLLKNKRVMSEFRCHPNDPGGFLD